MVCVFFLSFLFLFVIGLEGFYPDATAIHSISTFADFGSALTANVALKSVKRYREKYVDVSTV